MPEEEEKKKKLLPWGGLLTEFVQNTPCARGALLHGSAGYAVAGLLHFLVTSRVRRSFDVGMAGFLTTTLASWSYCRYTNARLRVRQRVIQDGMKKRAVYEGSRLDPHVKPKPTEQPSTASGTRVTRSKLFI